MGTSISSFKKWWNGERPINIGILGIDAAGKTSILYRMKLGEQIQTVSTSGFNVEPISYKNVNYSLWDMGGADKLRFLQYREQAKHMQAIIWVVDSTDKDRFFVSKEELDFLLEQEGLKGKRLLVLNTKSDLPDAAPTSEVVKHLGLAELEDREWCIVKCSAKTGEGIWEGFENFIALLLDQRP